MAEHNQTPAQESSLTKGAQLNAAQRLQGSDDMTDVANDAASEADTDAQAGD